MANGHGGARAGAGHPRGPSSPLLARRTDLKERIEGSGLVEQAITELRNCLTHKSGMVRIAAIQIIFERYAGRAVQPIEGPMPDPTSLVMMRYLEVLRGVTPDEREAIQDALRGVAERALLPPPDAEGAHAG